jgi:MFS superfamily sulfate permease-like transporter
MKLDLKQYDCLKDTLPSIVVFLVALPLCMGVAIASGMPPAAGLISGIIGGVVVGTISGSPFQVSGPTVSLALIVWDIVNRYGAGALGPIVFLAGVLQICFGVIKLGRIFRAVSPAVVQGMLSGIGLLILCSQFHVMLDASPKGTGFENLIALPEMLFKVITLNDGVHEAAALIGLLTIVIILTWEKLPIEKLRNSLPPTLIAIIISTVVAWALSLHLNRVQLPESILSAIKPLETLPIEQFGWILLQQALVVALVASAETLLTANALDRMLPGHKSKYDQELIAQGVGNTLCGCLGALPLAGVIVRSSVNVRAGAQTKASTVMHGLWLLICTLGFSSLMSQIPAAALAAVLVYAGYRLIDVRAARRISEHGRLELTIYTLTVLTIMTTNLLTGVLVGVTLSAVKLLYVFCQLRIVRTQSQGRITLQLVGAATFFSLPKLAEVLDELPVDTELHVDFSRLTYIDHASLDLLMKWEEQYKTQGGTLTIDWGLLQAKFDSTPSPIPVADETHTQNACTPASG